MRTAMVRHEAHKKSAPCMTPRLFQAGRRHVPLHSSQGVSTAGRPGRVGVARKLQMAPGGICGTPWHAAAGAPNDEIEVESRGDGWSPLNPMRGMS
jgi:hypothetical protein